MSATGRTADGKKRQVGLAHQVKMVEQKMWPTPQAHDKQAGDAERVGRFGTKHGGRNLNDEVQKFPTPRTPTGGPQPFRTTPGGGLRKLEDKVALEEIKAKFPTPQSRDWKGQSQRGAYEEGRKDCLPNAVQSGGQLNPNWVAWLMGFPVGWTDLDASATPSCPRSPSSSGEG